MQLYVAALLFSENDFRIYLKKERKSSENIANYLGMHDIREVIVWYCLKN